MKAHLLPTNDLAFGREMGRKQVRAPVWLHSWWWWQKLPVHGRSRKVDRVAARVMQNLPRMAALSEEQLRARRDVAADSLRQDGLSERALIEAFLVSGEAMRRSLGFVPFRSQITAARQMLLGQLAEMQTGEGKTLAAALAASVAGLGGASVLVLTANEYLVQRDQAMLEPLFDVLGLSSGHVCQATAAEERKALWRRTVTYSTASELAFEYLRDYAACKGNRDPVFNRVRAIGREEQVSEGTILDELCFCLVDEADSILLDDAVVPLILATASHPVDEAAYRRAFVIGRELIEADHFTVRRATRQVLINAAGQDYIATRVIGAGGDLYPLRRAIELVATAVCADRFYWRDRDYVVVDDSVQLIDQMTGRIASGRQWQGALQQMTEIKESLELSAPTVVSAQITYQQLFPRFPLLGGMSGTLIDARSELASLYGLRVVPVPLSFPCKRIVYPEKIELDSSDKWQRVLREVQMLQACGRPVLVGTSSVAESEALSQALDSAGIAHQVLHASQSGNEAELIGRSGRAGVVTVTTNMAGRGTDIELTEAARRNGGLHVIATMRNRSKRIDRQLIGRAARQGDPGSCQSIVSLEDSLMVHALAAPVLATIKKLFQLLNGQPNWLFRRCFDVAQALTSRADCARRHALDLNETRQRDRMGFAGYFE